MSDRPDIAIDVLTDVLSAMELRGWLHSRTEATTPWRFDFQASPDSIFHVLGGAGGYLLVDGHAAVQVGAGDLIVFPHGDPHALADDPGSGPGRTVRLEYEPSRPHHVFPFAGDGTATVMLCGVLRLARGRHRQLLGSLPAVMHIRGADGRLSPETADIVALIARESRSQRPGTEAVLRRLTEILFIHMIRAWLEQQSANSRNWLRGLNDPAIGRALSLIHQAPERRWTVAELAAAVALSRSQFAARFTELVAESPINYAAQWRMEHAARLLRTGATVPAVAARLGYTSEVAFRKAFARQFGIPPGAYRRTAADGHPRTGKNAATAAGAP
ncbi:AraC family transcriptional regulator [Nocardia sp. NPDC004604]|uniref:AraC family transcriptional regulator n=1 Tax=Nocardia sp. NPDC004604 TaxID=3157013 RepID=UPI0033BE354C